MPAFTKIVRTTDEREPGAEEDTRARLTETDLDCALLVRLTGNDPQKPPQTKRPPLDSEAA